MQTTQYNHDGVMLNVTVDRDAEGCVIERVTVGRDDQDISHLFSGNTLASMADCVDAQLTREAQQHNAAVRAERHQWHKEFRVAA